MRTKTKEFDKLLVNVSQVILKYSRKLLVAVVYAEFIGTYRKQFFGFP